MGAGTSKANTALLHTGFDAKPGTLEARLVARGYELLGDYAERVGIPVERTGALLVAWNDEQVAEFPGILGARARVRPHATSASSAWTSSTGASRCLAQARAARSRCPARGSSAPSRPRSRTPPRRCWPAATCAARPRSAAVARLDGGGFRLTLPGGALSARYLVNAAGLRSDELDRMLGHDGFTVTPRRGELIVFDKLARPLVRHIVLAVPTKITKGVLIAPTVFGNVMLGPTAEDVERKDDTGSTRAGLDYLRAEGARIMPELLAPRGDRRVRGPARRHRARRLPADGARAGGLRVRGRHPLDRAVGVDGDRGARARRAGAAGLRLEPKERRPARVPDAEHRRAGRASLPARRADRARRRATGASSASASGSPAARSRTPSPRPCRPVDLDGLRRRTRAHMGRCQGFFCGAELAARLDASGAAP